VLATISLRANNVAPSPSRFDNPLPSTPEDYLRGSHGEPPHKAGFSSNRGGRHLGAAPAVLLIRVTLSTRTNTGAFHTFRRPWVLLFSPTRAGTVYPPAFLALSSGGLGTPHLSGWRPYTTPAGSDSPPPLSRRLVVSPPAATLCPTRVLQQPMKILSRRAKHLPKRTLCPPARNFRARRLRQPTPFATQSAGQLLNQAIPGTSTSQASSPTTGAYINPAPHLFVGAN